MGMMFGIVVHYCTHCCLLQYYLHFAALTLALWVYVGPYHNERSSAWGQRGETVNFL